MSSQMTLPGTAPATSQPTTPTPTRTIPEPILDILARCRVEGTSLYLPDGQLDRKTYTDVNKVIETLGGKWSRSAKAHVFEDDPSGMLADVVATGRYHHPADLGWFPTPEPLARYIIGYANLYPGVEVLEPSAGKGALAEIIAETVGRENVFCVEIDAGRAAHLVDQGYPTICHDFLTWQPERPFDRIVMNPPFAKQQDIDHVQHAWSMLAPGGTLVAIMSKGSEFNRNRKGKAFQQLVDRYGHIFDNAENAFKESGTGVRTITVVLDKPFDGEDA